MKRLRDAVLPASKYFENLNQEIDEDETGDKNLISLKEYMDVSRIISCEAAIYLLRNSPDGGDFFEHIMHVRRDLIKKYNEEFKKDYKSTNDYLGG